MHLDELFATHCGKARAAIDILISAASRVGMHDEIAMRSYWSSVRVDAPLPVSVHIPFARAFALQSFSIIRSPAPDLFLLFASTCSAQRLRSAEACLLMRGLQRYRFMRLYNIYIYIYIYSLCIDTVYTYIFI